MRTRGVAATAALCALVAGCLPDRDNPRDPVNRVTAALVVADWTPDGGLCGSPMPAGENPVSVAPIAHCLVLDARNSSKPAGARLHFTFSGGSLPEPVTTDDGFLVLDDARFALTVDTSHTFSVTARTSEDSDSATASVVLVDSYPAVQAGAGRTLPEGGFPWSPGEAFDVTLTARGVDADGDPLLYCWRESDGSPIGCSTDGELQQALTTSAQLLVTVVVASDGKLASLPSTEIVRVAPPTIWTGTGWVDPGRLSVAGMGMMTSRSATASGPYLMTVSQSTGPGTLRIYDRETLQPLAEIVDLGLLGFPDHLFVPRYDPASRRVWAMGVDFKTNLPASARHRFLSFILSDDATTLTPDGSQDTIGTEPIAAPDIGNGYVPIPFAVLSSNGDGWLSAALSTHVYGVHPDGTVFSDGAGFSGHVTGLAARPGTGEVWSAWESSSKLVRFDREGDGVAFPIASTRAVGLAFVDEDRAWTWIADRGFVLFDVSRLEETGSFDASVIVEEIVPVDLGWEDGPSFLADPVLGSVYATCAADSAVWVVGADGSTKRFPFTSEVQVVGVDSDGSVHFTLADGVVRASAPAQNGSYASGVSSLMTSIDWSRGGLWLSRNTSPTTGELVHIDESGRVDDYVSSSVDAASGNVVAVPHLDPVGAASPDGLTLWSYDGALPSIPGPTKLHSYVVTTSSGEHAFESREHTPLFNMQSAYFVAPFSPVNDTSNRLAWAGSDISNTLRIYDHRQAAAVATIAVAIQPSVRPARSMLTNDLCYVTDESFPSYSFARISTGLTITPITTISPTAINPAPLIAAASDPAYDACWISFVSGATQSIASYDRDGTLLHSSTIAAGTTSIRANGAHSVYVNVSGTVTRLDFTPGVLGSPVTASIATGASSTFSD